MNALHDALALIERDAAADFATTELADDLSPVTSAVRRGRFARATAAVGATVAVVVGGLWAVNTFGMSADVDPAASFGPDSAVNATDPSVPSEECANRAQNLADERIVVGSAGALRAHATCSFWGGTVLLRADAAVAMVHMNAKYRAETGADLCISVGYTPRGTASDVQEFLTATSGRVDPHAYGLAVDACGGSEGQLTWMLANAPAFGWERPALTADEHPNHWTFAESVFALTQDLAAAGSDALLSVDSTTPAIETAATLARYYGVAVDEALLGLESASPLGDGDIIGWLPQGVYNLSEYESPTDFAHAAGAIRQAELEALGVPREGWLRTLTLASLIERESRLEVDMTLVSGVIHNRLASEMPLELDSTILFVTGGSDPFITAAERQIDSPYNTYINLGLPPGPIATPGSAALQAAVNPYDGTYLYFVVVNMETGEMRFATTLEDHVANVALLQEWYTANGA